MDTRGLLEDLRELSRLKDNWYSVAVKFEALKNHWSGMEHFKRRIMEACEASGYSLNTLNRMLSVRAFFDSVKDEVKELEGVDPNTLSFPSLEVVRRWYQVNQKEAIQALAKVAGGRITYRKLRERYDQSISKDAGKASVHQLTKRKGRGFKDTALEAIRSSCCDLFDMKNEMTINKVNYRPPFSIDVIALDSHSESQLFPVGFELFYLSARENPRRRLELLINDLLFKSYFFRAIWVVFPSSLGEERINAFSEMIGLLDRRSIGVAMLPWDENNAKDGEVSLTVIRRPTSEQSPDWHEKLRKFDELHQRLAQPG